LRSGVEWRRDREDGQSGEDVVVMIVMLMVRGRLGGHRPALILFDASILWITLI
jgi:hypothetical protein